ncbi:MAG: hypothetical protein LBJ23_04715 [Tannerella sp.]|jgi:hypothetical protein|nr:hypothetical protein [Tannerella sp.]
MADKEKLDDLIVRIRKLLKLTDEIYERDIYPVSFFSQAYDITGQIHESLKQMELAQIALFESQIKAHQAQIFSTTAHREKTPDAGERPAERAETPERIIAPTPPPPTPPPAVAPVRQELSDTAVPEKKEMPPVVHGPEDRPHTPPPAPPAAVSLNDRAEGVARQKSAADLKKWLTLNDRFRFNRELFGGSESQMNLTIAELNRINSHDKVIAYLKSHFDWNYEEEIVADFLAIVEKCFDK